ncbi:MAG TPA: zf-HC2 domain-containing protein [Actinomycetota bacterium]|nr:zf-HC2 domain-containing protein [Actinomycetota bacterium]
MLSLRKIACQQAVELMAAYLDGGLSRRDRRRLEAHLKACGNCSAYLDQIRTTIELAGRITPDDLAPEAQEELTDLYRAWRAG